ncbi:MAG: DUF3196 family protein [Firmicutes bacterium]|nr:DUF3196 family protein [Candidatus Colivicinus equi]
MNYYQDIINKITKLIENENFDEANKLIDEELNVPYVPKEYLDQLEQLQAQVKAVTFVYKSLTDEDIEKYLFMDAEHQLIAVNELNKKNLREYIDLCNKYLSSNGFKNAKVLLVDSLINQEIGEDIKYIDSGMEYEFIPKYVMPIEISGGFKKALKLIDDEFMKEPSMNKLARDLLYKECLMALPVNYEESEAPILAKNIIDYIYKAFNS